jgi:hypothetical protein
VLALHFAGTMYLVDRGLCTVFCRRVLTANSYSCKVSSRFHPHHYKPAPHLPLPFPFTPHSRGRQDSTSQATAPPHLLSDSPPLHRWRPARASSPSSRSSPSPPAPRGRQTRRETRSTRCANALRTPTACWRAGIPPS